MKNVSSWLALVAFVLLTACAGSVSSSGGQPQPQQSPGQIAQLPLNAEGIPLVARVNDAEISLPQFQRALTRRQMEVAAADPLALEADVLEQLIAQVLIAQGAVAQEIVVTDEEVQAELQINLELAGTPEVWAEWLQINGYTPEEFNETLRATLVTNRIRDLLTGDLEGDVPQAHARHILVPSEAEAQALLRRLGAGEDFALLAGQYSLDETTRAAGGDLGWFTQEELLVPELSQTAFLLQPGQIGGPVVTALGYHIVQTLETGSRPVEPERRVYIAQARFETWLDTLRQSAIIERYW